MVQQFALGDDEQQVLWALLHDPATPPRLAQRAQIILLAAYGRSEIGRASCRERV